jgi:enoyl-[acyl-carrier protein] reductase II
MMDESDAIIQKRIPKNADNIMSVAPKLRTRLTELLKCKYPLILPGMSWISTPELVAAVSNAGGVGILATGPLDAESTRRAVHRIRELLVDPDLPFGIGATLLMPGAADNAKVALDEHVPIINVSLGKADWIVSAVHDYGGTMISTVTNRKHAESAIAVGADALMVTGHEAAAHGGDVTSLVLIPTLSEAFPDTPLIAAGGFANGRGLAAALALGADGVAMGSRLAVSQDSPLPLTIQEAIIAASESDTVYGSNFDGISARVLKTPLSQQLMKSRPFVTTIAYRAWNAARAMKIPLWKVLPGLVTQFDKMYTIAQFGAATERLMTATVHGNLQEGVQFIGQSQGLINDSPTVDELIQRIVKDAQRESLKTSSLFVGNST